MDYFKLLSAAYDSLPAESAVQKAIIFKVAQYYDKNHDTALSAIKLVKEFSSKVFLPAAGKNVHLTTAVKELYDYSLKLTNHYHSLIDIPL